MKYFDMFSGIGGFRAAFLQIDGFECIGHCENDKFADRSYRAIYSTEKEWFCEDARKIRPEEMPYFDMLCAGFPCQSFSVAGKRRGFEDTRGTLFFEIARVAREKQPSFLLLENVPGLLSHDKGRTFGTILATLSELGYSCEWAVLNSKNFGVPQYRRRLYAFCYLDSRCAGKIFPIKGSNRQALKQLIGGSQGQRVYDPSGLSCTLTSHGGGQGAKCGLYFIAESDGGLTNGSIRKLMPEETWYLQGFSREQFAKAAALNSDVQLYKQAGNAVTVPVVYQIGLRIKELLCSLKEGERIEQCC